MYRCTIGRLRRDPGVALLLLALVLAIGLYAPTLDRGLVNYDDPWLVRDNPILQAPSLHTLHVIAFDTSRDTRAALGAEYLPVRDLSIMLDSAIWGDQYAGYHLTNLVLYVLALVLWFCALAELGIDRRICGLTVLLWAVHPAHAESVAWISERKGVLALALAGLVAVSYAKFRAGRHGAWLFLAVVASVAAVWSKALAAFSIAALGGLELVLPERRVAWKRSAIALATLAVTTAAAFVPVFVVASRMAVVASDVVSPGNTGWLAMVLGVQGLYVQLALLAWPNAVSYPINTDGPTVADVVIGGAALAVFIAFLIAPRVGRWSVPATIKAASVIWLVGWFPASRIVLPVRLVVAADRYLLFPTLGIALAVAAGVLALRSQRGAVALVIALVVASSARTLDAQASWQSGRALWARAVESNPHDANARSMYAEALIDAGALDEAERTLETGLAHAPSSRLMLRRALLLVRRGDREGARTWMRRAAEAGEPIAMANLASMLADAGDPQAGLEWARKAVSAAPLYANGYRMLGKLALMVRNHVDALSAFERAFALEPSTTNEFNLALALIAVGQLDAARAHLRACSRDPALAARVQAEMAKLLQ